MNTNNNDDLRNRFTAWITTLVRRTRIDYLRRIKRKPIIVSFDDVAESSFCNERFEVQSEECFENSKLNEAIGCLSEFQQEVIKMLFIDEMKPYEVTIKFGRTEQYIYNLRYRILKTLKEKLGDKNDD